LDEKEKVNFPVVCPVCGLGEGNVGKDELTEGDFFVYDCARCGKFKISRTAYVMVLSGELDEILPYVSSWIRESNEFGEVTPFLESYVFRSIQEMAPDRSDESNVYRVLKYLDRKTDAPGKKVLIVEHFDCSVVQGGDVEALRYYMEYLIKNGFVVYCEAGEVGDSWSYHVRLEIEGRDKLQKMIVSSVSRCAKTSWADVDGYMDAAYDNLKHVSGSPYYKNCAHSCREALVALSNHVYSQSRHGTFVPDRSSYSNALTKLELVAGDALSGGKKKEERSMAKAAISFASKLAHADTVELSQAQNCFSSVKAVIEIIFNSLDAS